MLQFVRESRGVPQKLSWRSILAVGLSAVFGVAFGHNLLGSVSVVLGTSMSPAFPPGTHVYTQPVLVPLQRGDVVLLDDGETGCAVKRIIGLPGEIVHIWRGHVFIDRNMLLEPYLPRFTYTYPSEGRGATFVLGETEYFVMGDNRLDSTDSRDYGPVPLPQIKRLVPLADNEGRPHFVHYSFATIGRAPQPL